MWLASTLSILLAASSTVSAGLISSINHGLARRDNLVDSIVQRYTDTEVEKRQTASPTAFNTTAWGVQTSASCVNTLRTLNGIASNPAGLALCYNIVSLDTTNGSFYADMRIYMIAAPAGTFANVPAQNVMVAAQFAGASVQSISEAALQKREEFGMESWPSIRRAIDAEGKLIKRAADPVLVQSYGLFGVVNMAGVTANTDVRTMEALLTPTVTLSATTTSIPATVVNTTLSTTEATFIEGVFSNAIAMAQSLASNAPNMTGIAATVVPAGTLFRMPGTKILIFPIGAIITGAWAVLLIGTIAFGTVGRMRFREQFRRRTAREAKMAGKDMRI